MSYEFANWIASLEAHDWILSNWCVFGHVIRQDHSLAGKNN